jgi:hypothetical protein
MTEEIKRTRLETEALVIGYAMSRLDTDYLAAYHYQTWQEAYQEAAQALSEPTASFKNLRDEFDPVHPNPRRGWHLRSLRPNRQRVLDEMQEVSDDALLELVRRILQRDEEATAEAIDALATVTRRPASVAERLLTGRRAEEYFLAHSLQLAQVDTADILDLRQSALGFDFGVKNRPEQAIEVKGLKPTSGGIQFTDREWSEAKYRRENYWLVVVGNLAAEPAARVFRDPYGVLEAACVYQQSVTAVWRSTVSVTS